MEQKPGTGILNYARNWYARFERPISSISLLGGFVFDALTLRRVDRFWDNVWVAGHLVIVTICIVWINLLDNETDEEGKHPAENPQRIHFWLVFAMQFFFGGILSTYLVFYFRSGTIATSWPFLLILAIAFVANEALKRHYARIVFQITILFLAFYGLAIYILPILIHEINTWVFILSGIVSLAAIGLVILLLIKYSHGKFTAWNKFFVALSISVVFIGINWLYVLHLIPPLPLSLTDGQIYQSLTINGPGQYTAQYEEQGGVGFIRAIENYFDWNQTVHIEPGEPLFAYTAIFAPTYLKTNVIHQWQHYDTTQKKWITHAEITLPVSGGRDDGWRTFSEDSGITAGLWRVNVLTPAGGVIGRLNFNVVVQNTEPALTTEEIQ